MPVKRVFWWLPRPSTSKYVGSFPRHFEIKLLRLLNIDPERHKILHPFGGASQYGDTVEPEWQKEHLATYGIVPTFWGDAHDLHWIKDETYDLVICDPPYSNMENKELYKSKKLIRFGKYVREAWRVTKVDGLIALYHRNLLPRPQCCDMEYLIAIATRVLHSARLCGVFKKYYC